MNLETQKTITFHLRLNIMKNILFILALFSGSVMAQEVPKEFRKMNTMEITSDLADELLLKDIASRLMADNFDIEVIDEELMYLRTVPKAMASVQWQIRVKVTGNKAQFQNHTSMEISIYGVTSGGWDHSNFKSPAGPYGKISDGLFAFVSSFGKEISYFKK